MKTTDLEPGMLIQGPCGQIREIVSMDGGRATYIQVSAGSVNGGSPGTGGERTVNAHHLAAWAESDITETYGKTYHKEASK